MTDWCIGIVRRDLDQSHMEYALYGNWGEAKNAMLGIMSVSGVELLSVPVRSKRLRDEKMKVGNEIAKASIELLTMNEPVIPPSEEGNIFSFDTQIFLFFMTPDWEPILADIKKDAELNGTLKTELIADHRKCTQDFCFSDFSVDSNPN